MFDLLPFVIVPCIDFLEAFQNVPLTDSIFSTLCNEYTENHLLSVQEVNEPIFRYKCN